MPVIGVDKKVDFRSTDHYSSEAGALKCRNPTENHCEALRILINVWWEVGRANILPIGVTGFTGIT